MLINRQWIGKVSLFNSIMRVARGGTTHAPDFTSFIVECSLYRNTKAHAQREIFGEPHQLYILIRGLVSGRGRILQSGGVWGVDFVLSDLALAEPHESQAVTYVELTTLSRGDFLALVERYSTKTMELKKMVRHYCCWLALQRAIMQEAARQRNNGNDSSTISTSLEPTQAFRKREDDVN